MALAELLKRITATQQTLQVDRLNDYRKLVIEIADEHEPDAVKVAVALSEAGKSVEELSADVEHLIERRCLSKLAKKLPEVERKMLAIRKKSDIAHEAFAKIEEKHDMEMQKLDAQYNALRKEQREGEQAAANLIQSVTDESILARQRELSEAITAKHNELKEAHDLLELRKRRLVENTEITRSNPQECAEVEASWTKKVQASKNLISGLEKELETIQAEQASFNKHLVEP
jgi:hypothetical protein